MSTDHRVLHDLVKVILLLKFIKNRGLGMPICSPDFGVCGTQES